MTLSSTESFKCSHLRVDSYEENLPRKRLATKPLYIHPLLNTSEIRSRLSKENLCQDIRFMISRYLKTTQLEFIINLFKKTISSKLMIMELNEAFSTLRYRGENHQEVFLAFNTLIVHLRNQEKERLRDYFHINMINKFIRLNYNKLFKFFLKNINYTKIPLATPENTIENKKVLALRSIEELDVEHLQINIDFESVLNLTVDMKKRYIYLDKGGNQIVSVLHFDDINHFCMNILTHFLFQKSFEGLSPESVKKFKAWMKD